MDLYHDFPSIHIISFILNLHLLPLTSLKNFPQNFWRTEQAAEWSGASTILATPRNCMFHTHWGKAVILFFIYFTLLF
jgi:hypothetical protein